MSTANNYALFGDHRRMEKNDVLQGFAFRFREACDERFPGATQEEIAKAIGVSQPTISDYMQGNKLPKIARAIRISQVLHVCVQWLLVGTGAKYPVVSHLDELTPKQIRNQIQVMLDRLTTQD